MATKKRPYHHGDLRRTLLESSVELIRERGVEALSLREVARRAGVSPAAPYHHFATREELFAALARDGFRLLGQAMRRAREATTGGVTERFQAIGEAYVRFALAHPAHYRLMFRPAWVDAAKLSEDDAAHDAFEELLLGVSDLLESDALAAHADRRGLVLVAWSLVHGAADLLLDGPFAAGLAELGAPAEAIPTLVTRAFSDLLRALRGPDPPETPAPVRRERLS